MNGMENMFGVEDAEKQRVIWGNTFGSVWCPELDYENLVYGWVSDLRFQVNCFLTIHFYDLIYETQAGAIVLLFTASELNKARILLGELNLFGNVWSNLGPAVWVLGISVFLTMKWGEGTNNFATG